MWKLSRYVKTIVAVIGAAAGVMVTVSGDDVLTVAEGVQIALAVLTALGVYALPNAPAAVDAWPAPDLSPSRRLEGDR